MTYHVRLMCTQIYLNIGDRIFPIITAIKCFYVRYLIDENTLMNKKVSFINEKTGSEMKLL